MATKKVESSDALEHRVKQVVTEGTDVQAAVYKITLDAMSNHALGLESIGRIMQAVVKGTRDGVQDEIDKTKTQTQAAQAKMKDAISGLDAALTKFAATTKLALEEAAGKAQKFSSQDMVSARADLESLEELFLETMKTSANATRGLASDMLSDMVAHTRRTGTAVGEQIKSTLETLTHQMTAMSKTQVEAGMRLAQTTADMMRNAAVGMLTGMADRIQQHVVSSKKPRDKES